MTNDLATLFARQLEVGGVSQQPAARQVVTPPTPESSPLAQHSACPPVCGISQHYHHSSHQALPDNLSTQPAETTNLQGWEHVSPEQMLKGHGIEPSSLFPSQLTLFNEATLEQKLHMIELWRISHKKLGSPSSPLALHDTPIATSEMTGVAIAPRGDQYFSSHEPSQMSTTVSGTGDDDMMDMDSSSNHGHAEPYVISGYRSLSQGELESPMDHAQQSPSLSKEPSAMTYSHSTDPVYKDHDFPHQLPEQQESMENQYGAFQIRNVYFGCGIRTAHWLRDNEML